MDNLGTILGGAVGGGLGLKWFIDWMREERAAKRGEQSESLALKILKDQVAQLLQRVTQLEVELKNRDDERDELNKQLDEERNLRRKAEDELDLERRERRELTLRVQDLEQKI
jgi:chromosome segregation ATPase